MPILPHYNRPIAPAELAFKSNRGDYWGGWKTIISGKNLSQEDQRRYREAGVTAALPDPDTSRAFFEWLSDHDNESDVVNRHIPCVLRQILHRNGPTDWASTYTHTRFIPVQGADGPRLVSLRRARNRPPVYLDDTDGIGAIVVEKDRNVMLAISRAREVAEPISEPLREWGVRSLREAIGEPISVAGNGGVVPANPEIRNVVQQFGSAQFRKKLRKQLDALGVESDLLRRDWQDRIGRIRDVSCADEVRARYRFRGKIYSRTVAAGFDPGSGVFWTRHDDGIRLDYLYEAIAAQLVFKSTARPVDWLALERAVTLEIRELSFGRPRGIQAASTRDEDTKTEGARTGEDDECPDDVALEDTDSDPDPGEARSGHSPFEPDLVRNTPRPGPIPAKMAATPRRASHGQSATSPTGSNDSAPAPDLERTQVEDLKRNQYASHCQMCLCKHPPQVLAPADSYVQWEEVRRRIVEAHHVDLKSAGGARHAGNLILLCRLHHENFGRQLTREAIASALRTETREKRVHFGGDSNLDLTGEEIEIQISGTGEVVKLFFTKPHADYWRSPTRTPN